MRAVVVRDLSGPVRPGRRTTSQRLYRCDPGGPLPQYVVASAAAGPRSGPETYVFAADENGVITEWDLLTGSARGDLDHDAAIRRAGYEVEVPS